MRTLQIIAILIGMHIIGSAILFGYVSGVKAIIFAPLLGIFGWPFLILELIGIGLQWNIYKPYPEQKWHRAIKYALISASIGALIVAPLVPKVQNNAPKFLDSWFIGWSWCSILFIILHPFSKNSYFKKDQTTASKATAKSRRALCRTLKKKITKCTKFFLLFSCYI